MQHTGRRKKKETNISNVASLEKVFSRPESTLENSCRDTSIACFVKMPPLTESKVDFRYDDAPRQAFNACAPIFLFPLHLPSVLKEIQ